MLCVHACIGECVRVRLCVRMFVCALFCLGAIDLVTEDVLCTSMAVPASMPRPASS